MPRKTPGPHGVALGEERLFVDKHLKDRERVRVRTQVQTHHEQVSDDLHSYEFDVQRVPIGREIGHLPEIRREGDVLIIPVVDEEVVVTKRLILKEELRIVRRVRTRRFEQSVPVRRMRAVVEREPLTEADDQRWETPDGPDNHSTLRHQERGGGRQAADPGRDRRR